MVNDHLHEVQRANMSLHQNTASCLAKLQRLPASSELGRYDGLVIGKAAVVLSNL